jgi:hypothetical protein
MHKGLSGAAGGFVRAALPALCVTFVTETAAAAWIDVSTTDMTFDDDDRCSLPEAIHALNSQTAVDTCAAGDGNNDLIDLDAEVYVVESTLGISRSVVIWGWGVGGTTVRANLASGTELFLVQPGPETTTQVEFLELNIDRDGSQAAPNVTGVYAVSTNPQSTLYVEFDRVRVADHTWGGIYGDGAGLTIVDSTIEGNFSPWAGGGVSNNNFGDPNNGGVAGTLWIAHSTINDNTSSSGGGGVYHGGRGTSTLVNSTISGNSASHSGGGLWLNSEAEYFIIQSSTIAYNGAGQTGGGIYHTGFGNYCFESIIANNVSHAVGQDWDGEATFMRNSLVSNSWDFYIINDDGGNLLDYDPVLSNTLQNLGGWTKVHALLTGSPAIDHVTPVSGGLVDQRHAMRGVDGDGDTFDGVDIGAYEHHLN